MKMTNCSGPEISVVVPFYQEAEVANSVVQELCEYLAGRWNTWETILVNDGSTDATEAELERAKAKWPSCRVIHFSENQGQGAALLRGIREARAPIVATMDGDGQNVPEDMDKLLPFLQSVDLVVGRRVDRCDSLLRRGMSLLANSIRAWVLGDGLADAGCAMKLFRREVSAVFFPVYILHPYMPALAMSGGFRVAEVPVCHRIRKGGRSKYGFRAMLFRPMYYMLKVRWAMHTMRTQLRAAAPLKVKNPKSSHER